MITDYLSKGAANAKTARELAKLLDCDTRGITQIIESERRAGAPIISSNDPTTPGYYLAETAEEVQHYCRRLHQRAGEIFKTRRALLKTAQTMPQQEPQQ